MENEDRQRMAPDELAQEVQKFYENERPGTVRFMDLCDYLEQHDTIDLQKKVGS